MTKTEVVTLFRKKLLPVLVANERRGKPDYRSRAATWQNFVTALHQGKYITRKQHDAWIFNGPDECGT